MKTIGLIGGMSWESSHVYYELINKRVRELLGGFHSCKSLLLTVDFAEIEHLQHAGDWNTLNLRMATAARQLEKGGADLVLLCTNTMHLCSEAITNSISIPFLHIASATGQAIQSAGLQRVGLLGTRFTMEKDFYRQKLMTEYDIEVVIPNEEDRIIIHNIIYQELVHGIIQPASRQVYQQVIHQLVDQGAQGIILGCTEIPLLIAPTDAPVPIFDTTSIHAHQAVQWALS